MVYQVQIILSSSPSSTATTTARTTRTKRQRNENQKNHDAIQYNEIDGMKRSSIVECTIETLDRIYNYMNLMVDDTANPKTIL